MKKRSPPPTMSRSIPNPRPMATSAEPVGAMDGVAVPFGIAVGSTTVPPPPVPPPVVDAACTVIVCLQLLFASVMRLLLSVMTTDAVYVPGLLYV